MLGSSGVLCGAASQVSPLVGSFLVVPTIIGITIRVVQHWAHLPYLITLFSLYSCLFLVAFAS
jgi:hypothetical protein